MTLMKVSRVLVSVTWLKFYISGEVFMYFLYLFGGLSSTEKEALLAFKRAKLAAIDWNHRGFNSITVQKGGYFYPSRPHRGSSGIGFWFSAHENWGWMQLPYIDTPLLQ